MSRGRRDGLLIAGGGLAGSLAALAMARARPEVPILLVEEGQRFGGNHIWSFFDGDVEDEDRWLVDPLVSHHWDGYYVAFPEHSRKLRAGYNRPELHLGFAIGLVINGRPDERALAPPSAMEAGAGLALLNEATGETLFRIIGPSRAPSWSAANCLPMIRSRSD